MPYVAVTLKSLRTKDFDFEPTSIGEHIKKHRLKLGLDQQEVAKLLAVSVTTIINWEKGYTEPAIHAIPAIIRLLGYDPFPCPQTLHERMLTKRKQMGWSIRQAARAVGVDPATWKNWERTGIVAWPTYQNLLDAFLDDFRADLPNISN